MIFDFYNGVLGSSMNSEVTINLDELDIASHNLTTLKVPITDEVWKTISGLPSDKVPVQMVSQVVSTKCVGLRLRRYHGCNIGGLGQFRNFELLNSAYITLLPKKDGAEKVHDFRPISLVHSFAKLITKILANRFSHANGVTWVFQDLATGMLRHVDVPNVPSFAQQQLNQKTAQNSHSNEMVLYQSPSNQPPQQPTQGPLAAQPTTSPNVQPASATLPLTPSAP